VHRIFFILFTFIFCWESSKVYIPKRVKINDMNVYSGLDILQNSKFNYLKNKNIGLVINHTSVNRQNSHILDLLKSIEDIKLKKIFTPEHGLRGKLSAGEHINSGTEKLSGIEFISLYGKNKKPTPNDLIDIDLMIFDIQDVGSRYYTYVSTLTYILDACAENNIPVLILDRPNPLNGINIDGPILDSEFSSFVGMHQIPILHGMSIGELAIMINELNWLDSRLKVELTVIPVINWQRNEEYSGSVNGWLPPSPNIPDLETARLYSGFCLLEGTNLSEGRGTLNPFKIIGAPWLNTDSILNHLDSNVLHGIKIDKIKFTPISIPEMSKWPKYENQKCNGFKISILNKKYNSLKFIIELLSIIQKTHSNEFEFLDSNFIDKLYGSNKLRNTIIENNSINSLINSWNIDRQIFNKKRSKYLIYN
jgi:uncharacterized protein YbbC (DUF1343 family)